MNIDLRLLDSLTEQAKASPRLRMNMDLRDSAEDQSQRMLNALEPGTMLPIHRHRKTAETVAILRGRAVQHLYDEEGRLTESVLLEPFGADCHVAGAPRNDMEAVPAMQVEKGQWHRLESLETGTVIVEFKNGPYEPIGVEDIWEGYNNWEGYSSKQEKAMALKDAGQDIEVMSEEQFLSMLGVELHK